MVHVRFEGMSLDVREEDLRLSVGMKDTEIRQRIARHLEVDANRLRTYVVDRTSTGNLIVRPEAVYG